MQMQVLAIRWFGQVRSALLWDQLVLISLRSEALGVETTDVVGTVWSPTASVALLLTVEAADYQALPGSRVTLRLEVC